MPNKHFCQGPTCHEQVTTDRFLKSRGVRFVEDMHMLQWTKVQINGGGKHQTQINISVVNLASFHGYLLTWKTLNKVDQDRVYQTQTRVGWLC
jgi:hypothetical protein